MEPNGMITGFCSVTCEMRGEGTCCESISCQQPLDTPPASLAHAPDDSLRPQNSTRGLHEGTRSETHTV